MGARMIALTGASGLVGSHIAAGLVARGVDLKCGLRESSSTQWLDGLDYQRSEFHLERAENFAPFVDGVDTVIHCAAITRAARNRQFVQMNADATRALAHEAVRAGVRRFVFVSSLAARGPDESNGPDSPYGHSKLIAERALAELQGKMEIIILRLGGVYGPRDTDLLPLFQMASRGTVMLPPRTQVLQPLFAEDAAASLVAACFCEPSAELLPVCEAGRYSWEQVAGYIRNLMGTKLRVLHLPAGVFVTVAGVADGWARLWGNAPQLDLRRGRDMAANVWTCDVSATEEALSWQAKTSLPEGLQRTWDWYHGQGWLKP